LKQDDLGYDDNFFELGGHSLIANQVINRIRNKFHTEINFDDFFKYPTIRLLSEYVDARLQRRKPLQQASIPVLPVQKSYEVSHAQKRLWVLGQTTAGAMAYNQPGLYEIESPLDAEVLKRSFDALINRHESLRTSFMVDEGDLVQVIHEPAASGFILRQSDFRGLENPGELALQYAREQALQPFDLEKGPLIRAHLVQVSEAWYVFLLDLHHIITDGWSNGVLIADLLAFYRAFKDERDNPLDPLRIQYKEYASWQNQLLRAGSLVNSRQYWLQQFNDGPVPLEFPTDYSRPAVKTYEGRILEFIIDPGLTDEINSFCKQKDITLFMMLLANLYVLLYRFSGKPDITIGTPVANRDHFELEDQVGFYVNTLAIRTVFDPEEPFDRLLGKVKTNTLKAYEHSAYPFDLLVDELSLYADRNRSPLFDVMITLQNTGNHLRYKGSILEEWKVTSHETDVLVSKFDLTFSVSENEGRLEFVIEYDTALFTEKTIRKIKEGFIYLFQTITVNPLISVSDLRNGLYYMTEKEQVEFYKDFAASDFGLGQ